MFKLEINIEIYNADADKYRNSTSNLNTVSVQINSHSETVGARETVLGDLVRINLYIIKSHSVFWFAKVLILKDNE